MVSEPNMDPSFKPIKGPAQPDATPPPTKQWNPKPMTWLGMKFDAEQTKQLWSTISQSIGQAIEHDKQKAIEASRKLRKSTDLDDDGDDS